MKTEEQLYEEYRTRIVCLLFDIKPRMLTARYWKRRKRGKVKEQLRKAREKVSVRGDIIELCARQLARSSFETLELIERVTLTKADFDERCFGHETMELFDE